MLGSRPSIVRCLLLSTSSNAMALPLASDSSKTVALQDRQGEDRRLRPEASAVTLSNTKDPALAAAVFAGLAGEFADKISCDRHGWFVGGLVQMVSKRSSVSSKPEMFCPSEPKKLAMPPRDAYQQGGAVEQAE